MATDSPRFGLGRYDQGEAWDHTDLVNHVDEFSIERDTKANRPGTGDYDDQLFFAQDEGVLYQWDDGSSSWAAVAWSANASIDDTDSTYTTSGESVIYVDVSSGTVTVELASADAVAGKSIKIIDSSENASSNNITITTEGSQNINPGSNSSITLTVDGTYVELESDGSNWFTDRAAEKQSVSTDDATHNSSYTDPSGLTHVSRVADDHYGFLLQDVLGSTGGTNGSVTYLYDKIQLRMPGDASANDEARIFDSSVEFDPTSGGSVRIEMSNITIDDNQDAEIHIQLTDAPNSDGKSSDDFMAAIVQGNGTLFAQTQNDGTSNAPSDSSKSNSFVQSLDYFKLSWDGSSATAEMDDGSSTVSVTSSSNYPSGENLFLKIIAYDNNGSNTAANADYDIDQLQLS